MGKEIQAGAGGGGGGRIGATAPAGMAPRPAQLEGTEQVPSVPPGLL